MQEMNQQNYHFCIFHLLQYIEGDEFWVSTTLVTWNNKTIQCQIKLHLHLSPYRYHPLSHTQPQGQDYQLTCDTWDTLHTDEKKCN